MVAPGLITHFDRRRRQVSQGLSSLAAEMASALALVFGDTGSAEALIWKT